MADTGRLLKEGSEIMVVILLHSPEEKWAVFENIQRLTEDPESGLKDLFLEPHLPGLQEKFRESLQITVSEKRFNLVLLDRSQLLQLPLLAYDLLAVGMQVSSDTRRLWQQLSSVTWPLMDLDYPSSRSRVLLSYNLDTWNSAEEEAFPAMVHRTVRRVNKQGLGCGAVPKYVNFSQKTLFSDMLLDIHKLVVDRGYFLHQCVSYNDLFNLRIVLPKCEASALNQRDEDSGDNPAMVAAKMRHKEALSLILNRLRSHKDGQEVDLWTIVHSRNLQGQTLLNMVTLQGPELEEQKTVILRLEIQLHCLSDSAVSEENHVRDQINLKRCMRDQLKSSADSSRIQWQLEYLQGLPRTDHELKMEKCRVWCGLFWSVLVLGVFYSALDYGSDILLVTRYNRQTNNETSRERERVYQKECSDKWESGEAISIHCFPASLTQQEKFFMTILFILWPYPFFIYAFISSRQFKIGKEKVSQICVNISKCSGCLKLFLLTWELLYYFVMFLNCCLVWPIAINFIKFYQDGKFYLSKDMERVERENKREKSEVLWNMSRAMEVSFEASFQPTLQFYLFFPTLFQLTQSAEEFLNFHPFEFSEDGVLQPAQVISVVTSVISLSWGFTSYYSILKRGDMEKDVASLLKKIVFFLSLLFLIIPRLLVFVFFAYSLGPGNYKYLFVFIICHGFLMMIIHYIFSDARTYFRRGFFSFLHHMIGNGFANIYVHNWIRTTYPPAQHVSTLIRQTVMDLIVLLENVILLGYSLTSNITELRDRKLVYSCIVMGFHLLGLILKVVFYRYCHSWSWLILDYDTKVDDRQRWTCSLPSNMFLLGKQRQQDIQLCCLPRGATKVLCGGGEHQDEKEERGAATPLNTQQETGDPCGSTLKLTFSEQTL